MNQQKAAPLKEHEVFEMEVASMTREELLDKKDQLIAECIVIKGQLANARAKRITTGEFSDPFWFRKAQYAKDMKGREIQYVDRHLGNLRRLQHSEIAAASKEESVSFEKAFKVAAKRLLSGDQYDAVVTLATEIQND